jgi:hypothetical protein
LFHRQTVVVEMKKSIGVRPGMDACRNPPEIDRCAFREPADEAIIESRVTRPGRQPGMEWARDIEDLHPP